MDDAAPCSSPTPPSFFFFLTRPPHRSTLFPYTTLFRSVARAAWRAERRCKSPRPPRGSCRQIGRAPRVEGAAICSRSEEHTSELQSHHDLVCRLLLEKKNKRGRRARAAAARRLAPRGCW